MLQQYIVDNYVKIETQKLQWVKNNQKNIRAELYRGLQDCLNARENTGGINIINVHIYYSITVLIHSNLHHIFYLFQRMLVIGSYYNRRLSEVLAIFTNVTKRQWLLFNIMEDRTYF